MKYPKEQYDVLVSVLEQLSIYYDFTKTHPSAAHYLVYQQVGKSQPQNHLYHFGSIIRPMHMLSEQERRTAIKVINCDYGFILYPPGCNDSNITVACRKAIKSLNI